MPKDGTSKEASLFHKDTNIGWRIEFWLYRPSETTRVSARDGRLHPADQPCGSENNQGTWIHPDPQLEAVFLEVNFHINERFIDVLSKAQCLFHHKVNSAAV